MVGGGTDSEGPHLRNPQVDGVSGGKVEVGGRNRRVAAHRRGLVHGASAGLDRPGMRFPTRGWHGGWRELDPFLVLFPPPGAFGDG